MHPPHPVPALVFFLRSPIEVQSPALIHFIILPFETFLKILISIKKLTAQCIDLYSRGNYKHGYRHQGRHHRLLPFWHQ